MNELITNPFHSTSIIDLIGNPLQHHGRTTSVFGYLHVYEGETTMLFQSRDLAIHGDVASAVSVPNLMGERKLLSEACAGNYVRVFGEIQVRTKAKRLGGVTITMHDISRIEVMNKNGSSSKCWPPKALYE